MNRASQTGNKSTAPGLSGPDSYTCIALSTILLALVIYNRHRHSAQLALISLQCANCISECWCGRCGSGQFLSLVGNARARWSGIGIRLAVCSTATSRRSDHRYRSRSTRSRCTAALVCLHGGRDGRGKLRQAATSRSMGGSVTAGRGASGRLTVDRRHALQCVSLHSVCTRR